MTDLVIHSSVETVSETKRLVSRKGTVTLSIPQRTSLHGQNVPILTHTINMAKDVAGLEETNLELEVYLSTRTVGGLDLYIRNRHKNRVKCHLSHVGHGGQGGDEDIPVEPRVKWKTHIGVCTQFTVVWKVEFLIPKKPRH